MKIRYIGPHDSVETEYGDVHRGLVIDVPVEAAGKAPSPRVAQAHAELAQAVSDRDHEKARALREEIIGLDVGYGFLAQPEAWEAAAEERVVEDQPTADEERAVEDKPTTSKEKKPR